MARVEGFICAVVDEQFHSCVRGNLYPTVKDDDGSPEQYCYNFGKIVVPSLQQLISPTEKILCKVILYPDPEKLASPSHFIVIDFMRETVTVPFYPEPDDVVVVAYADGENCISLIKRVQEKDKTVKLFYYIADPGAGLYVRESHGHGSLQLVGWDCSLGLAEGHWEGNAWKQEIVRPT